MQSQLPDVGIRGEDAPIERRKSSYALPRRYNAREHVDLREVGGGGGASAAQHGRSVEGEERAVRHGGGLLAWVEKAATVAPTSMYI